VLATKVDFNFDASVDIARAHGERVEREFYGDLRLRACPHWDPETKPLVGLGGQGKPP